MDKENVNNLFSQFLKNGMNISEFKFHSIEDKKNLFLVYEEYLKSMMMDKDRTLYLYPNVEHDVTIFIDGREICMFEINYDYTSLYCHTNLELDDEDLVYCLSMFFLTIKEIKDLMQTLMRSFDKQASKSDINSKRKYKTLPSNTQFVVNKIQDLQDAIMKNINKSHKKYVIKKGDKK